MTSSYEPRASFQRTAVLVIVLICSPLNAADQWQVLYDDGFKQPGVSWWFSELTSSKRTAEGLQIVDPSTAGGSGRFYSLRWNVDSQKGATVEASLKCISCSGPSGVSLCLNDGIHAESITFFPDRIEFDRSKRRTAFNTADGFHTYSVSFAGSDIKLYADGKLLIDGTGKFIEPASGDKIVGFGAGSSEASGEAVWQRVRFRGAKPYTAKVTVPRVPGLQVAVGATELIVPKKLYVSMFKFANGDIMVDDKRSGDRGKTWQPAAKAVCASAYQFPDGEIVDLTPTALTEPAGPQGVFQVPINRSADNGHTVRTEKATINIPEGTGGTGDDGKSSKGPCCDHAIVGLRDGSLLAAMYGYFKTDTVLCEAFPKDWKVYKYRTFVVRSSDRGKTWDYFATVAYDPAVGCESFCEPDLLTLPNGDILCFMRTGGNGPPAKNNTPLYMSRSKDDGKTWSKPVPIADRGVWPNTCLMKNGAIVCTYGRPGNWLMFSLDQGKTWTGHFCFYDGASTSYNSVEEVEPDTLLVVYDRHKIDDDGNLAHDVMGTRFKVERE